MKTLVLLACVSASLLLAQSSKPPAVESPKAVYTRIVAQINAGQTDADWTALRFAAAQDGLSGDFDEVTVDRNMNDAYRAKKYDDALKFANQIIAYNMANVDAHYVAMVAYAETGQKKKQDDEEARVTALAHSIMGGKKGTSAADAWVTVSVDEEYFILRLMGMKPKMQALSLTGGRSYDVMTVTDRSDPGHEYTFWFDTEFSMDALAKMFDDGKKKK